MASTTFTDDLFSKELWSKHLLEEFFKAGAASEELEVYASHAAEALAEAIDNDILSEYLMDMEDNDLTVSEVLVREYDRAR